MNLACSWSTRSTSNFSPHLTKCVCVHGSELEVGPVAPVASSRIVTSRLILQSRCWSSKSSIVQLGATRSIFICKVCAAFFYVDNSTKEIIACRRYVLTGSVNKQQIWFLFRSLSSIFWISFLDMLLLFSSFQHSLITQKWSFSVHQAFIFCGIKKTDKTWNFVWAAWPNDVRTQQVFGEWFSHSQRRAGPWK